MVRTSIISLAFFEADSIAVIRAPYSPATDSMRARNTRVVTWRGVPRLRGFSLDGQELLACHVLHRHGAELVVHEVDLVHLAREIRLHQLVRDGLGVGVGEVIEEPQHLR